MERSVWLQEKRRMTEVRMDTLFAKDYDEHWGSIDTTHHEMLNRFLNLCLPQGTILDAACGTGKYWSIILASGRFVVGIDQSQQMLLKAQAKHPTVQVAKLGLQEMHFAGAFDGMICVDAIECVFPEDWPLVLANFHRALKIKAHLYFTVEITSEEDLRSAYMAGKQLGLPLVEGEHAHEGGITTILLLNKSGSGRKKQRLIFLRKPRRMNIIIFSFVSGDFLSGIRAKECLSA